MEGRRAEGRGRRSGELRVGGREGRGKGGEGEMEGERVGEKEV